MLGGRVMGAPAFLEPNERLTDRCSFKLHHFHDVSTRYGGSMVWCQSFGAAARSIQKWVQSGDLVMVQGKLFTRSYTYKHRVVRWYHKDGTPVYKRNVTEILVERLHILERTREDGRVMVSRDQYERMMAFEKEQRGWEVPYGRQQELLSNDFYQKAMAEPRVIEAEDDDVP